MWYAIIWLVAAIGLAVAEVFSSTLVLLMLAAGALAAAGAGALGVGLVGQLIAFGTVSAAGLIAVRPVVRRHLHPDVSETRMGIEAIEGSEGTVLEAIDADHGLVNIAGEMWRARPYDATQVIEVGEQVRVIEVKGATAMVWRD
ncbi:MAG TPA: NfeD family protein [Micromonosporaceae bacterium]|nr:NfeD family protein [Micromonosporaceae bacterium]